LEVVFILLEFPSPSRRIFIGSHSLPPSLVRRIGLSDPGFFGDDLQLVPGCIAFLLEPAVGVIIVARAGRVGAARRSRGIARHGWGCGWCRARIPPDEPETIEKIVREEKGSKGVVKKPMIITSGERRRGSLRPRRWPDACAAACHGALGSTRTREKKLRLVKA
jgi:hypothetical protein